MTEKLNDKLEDRYQLIEILGEGGFGVAWLAKDLTLLSRQVVVKTLKPKPGENNAEYAYRKRKFQSEIDALTRFHHPHIVRITDQGLLPTGEPFFVMDFIEGKSLQSMIQGNRLELARVAHILEQTGQVLSYAHEQGVVHRDLKPANIMVQMIDGKDFVTVIDFGIATVQEWKPEVRGGPTTMFAGSPAYMAPEQVDCNPVPASDTWALGVIAYELLTGQLPFPVPRQNGNVLRDKFSEILRAGVQIKPAQLRPELPAAAEACLLRALSFEPDNRFPRTQDFTTALASALQGQQTPPSSGKILTPDVISTVSDDLPTADVVISYAEQDSEQAKAIASHLADAGIRYWMNAHGSEIKRSDLTETSDAVRNCKAILLLCSDAALRSSFVKAQMQMAWQEQRPLIPLQVAQVSFDEQAQHWLNGADWIEAATTPSAEWLPKLWRLLAHFEVSLPNMAPASYDSLTLLDPIHLEQSLQGLLSVARFTDQIWPVPAEHVQRGMTRAGLRDLGAPQDDVQHGFPLKSHVCLVVESDRTGHLLLLDIGTSGKIYCLCPSHFAPETRLQGKRMYVPQPTSRDPSLVVSGKAGREQLLAIITDEPLGLDWMPRDPKVPARVLDQEDIDKLLAQLRSLDSSQWTALSTYFAVAA